jgi:hypothetical protein
VLVERNRLLSRRASAGLLIGLAAVAALICCLLPAIPQPQSYHQFADKRGFLGITNFGDVVSNLPFAVIGSWGIAILLRPASDPTAPRFVDPRERWPYFFVFIGLLLTACGSSYYHLDPNNARLVWDRLPMTVAFMAMVAAVITERISLRVGLRMLPILLTVGIASVLQWRWSESHGAGDLRFYAAVQGFSALVLLLSLVFPQRYTRSADFGWVVVFYVLAKILETFDKPIFAEGQIVSGHTLKHLAAGAAGYCILRMLQKRREISIESDQKLNAR